MHCYCPRCQSSILLCRECWGSYPTPNFRACAAGSRMPHSMFSVNFGPRTALLVSMWSADARSTSLVESITSGDRQNFLINSFSTREPLPHHENLFLTILRISTTTFHGENYHQKLPLPLTRGPFSTNLSTLRTILLLFAN